MSISQIITGVFTGIIALASGIYVSFTSRQKGSIFSNTYIWLSKAEKEKADKKSEYRLVTVVFGCISLFFCVKLFIFLQNSKQHW